MGLTELEHEIIKKTTAAPICCIRNIHKRMEAKLESVSNVYRLQLKSVANVFQRKAPMKRLGDKPPYPTEGLNYSMTLTDHGNPVAIREGGS